MSCAFLVVAAIVQPAAFGADRPAPGAAADEAPAQAPAPKPQRRGFQVLPGRNAAGNQQDQTPDAEKPVPNAGLVLADRTSIVRLARAREALERGNYGDAIRGLQSLLDDPEDGAFHIDQEQKSGLRSIKLEAERLIGAMPPEGRAAYESEYGPQAQRMLQDAREQNDALLLAEISRRLFHTRAGYEAAYLLATSHLDHNQPLTAALSFERLRGSSALTGRRRGMLCLKATMAWLMAGMTEQAGDPLRELYRLDPGFSIRLGGRRTTPLFGDNRGAAGIVGGLVRLARLIDRPATGQPAAMDRAGTPHWPMFRGNASRTASSVGSAPTMDVLWRTSTSSWTVPEEDAPFFGGVVDVGLQIAELEVDFQKRDRPAIPGVNPLIAGSVVLARTVNKLQAFDLETGTPLWEAQQDDALEQLRTGKVLPLPGDRGSLLDPLLLERVFTDGTYGTLSADSERVFALTGLGYSGADDNNNVLRSARNQPAHPLGRKTYNRLQAFQIDTGALAWQVGRRQRDDQPQRPASGGSDPLEPNDAPLSLAGHFFLGPPLPMAGRVYVLAEVAGQIRLIVLDAASGRLDWSQPLHSAATDVTQDVARGSSGLSPSYAGGILVCPTGAGVVVAVDVATRSLMWSHRYREPEDDNPRNRLRALALARLAAQRGDSTAATSSEGRWLDALPTLVAGRVILTPPGADELQCLNLTDGTPLWRLPRDDRLYVGGVYDGKLLVVGKRQFELLRLEDGRPAWRVPTELPLPSGRGLLVGNRFHVPLTTAAIATLDLESGRVVSLVESADGIVPGNLVSSSGRIIAQGARSIVCFRQRPPQETSSSSE